MYVHVFLAGIFCLVIGEMSYFYRDDCVKTNGWSSTGGKTYNLRRNKKRNETPFRRLNNQIIRVETKRRHFYHRNGGRVVFSFQLSKIVAGIITLSSTGPLFTLRQKETGMGV